jgi:hypothetical protein
MKPLNPLTVFLSMAGIAVAIMLVTMVACQDDKIVTQKDLRNRVPDVQTAQKAATDAQAAAASAQESLNAIQAKLDELQKAQKAAAQPDKVYIEGSPAERTGIGHVADVTEVFEPESSSYQYGEAYEAMTFVEDSGFQKRFYPVCSGQTIRTEKQEIIMYHWKPNLNSYHHNEKGCYAIDGYLYATTTR